MYPEISSVKHPRVALFIGLTVLAMLMTACAAGAGLAKPGDIGVVEDPVGMPDGRDNSGEDGGVPVPGLNGDGGTGVIGSPESDRSIVKTGEITVEVDNVPETTGEVRALAVSLGGYISSSFQGENQETATLTLRIPADQFDDAIAAIHDLDGEIKAEATSQEDVTAAVVDMEARLENLKAAEEQYRALLDQATDIEDILAIQNQLFAVRSEIESMEAQLKYLNDQADMSTLTVTIIPVPEPVTAATEDFDPGAVVEEAVASLASFGQWLVSAGIWFVIVGIPALIVLGILVWLGLRIGRRFAPKPKSADAPPAPAGEPPATS
jgi:hypothetical protein